VAGEINLVDELEQELKTLDTPQWKFEGCNSRDEYEEKYVRLVDDLLAESEGAYLKTKKRWLKDLKRVHMEEDDLEGTVSRTDLPLIPPAVEDAVAMSVENLPRGNASPRQSSQEDFAGALNYFMEEEYDSNDFDAVAWRAVFDALVFSFGCIKQTVDMEQTGPLGQMGRVIFKNIDPRHVWPDPKAKSWRWEDMRYLIVAEPMDLSEIRERWPGQGHLVEPEGDYSEKRNELELGVSEEVGDGYTVGQRHRAVVKECWIKDGRRVWEPMRDPNTCEEVKDSEGRPLGKWKKKYPYGRVVITANGVLLADVPNPFDHGQPPYSFLPGLIDRLMGKGQVRLIGIIADKINQLGKDGFRNLRVGCNSPWVADRNAFEDPDKFHQLTNDPGIVLPVTAGARVERLPPAELPQSYFMFMDWMQSQFDNILGRAAVAAGRVEKGSQLSAEAIANLQQSSMARQRLRQRMFELFLKHVAHLLQWNIRQFYPDQMQVELMDPRSGSKKIYKWTADAAKADYSIKIEAGSSMPGAKQGKESLARDLYKDGITDREYTIRMIDLPGADALIERMRKQEEKLAQLGMMAELKKIRPSSKRSA